MCLSRLFSVTSNHQKNCKAEKVEVNNTQLMTMSILIVSCFCAVCHWLVWSGILSVFPSVHCHVIPAVSHAIGLVDFYFETSAFLKGMLYYLNTVYIRCYN